MLYVRLRHGITWCSEGGFWIDAEVLRGSLSVQNKLDQTLLLGRTAHTIPELLEGITEIPESSIYYHTHKFLHQHHYLSPEPPNDFAYWVTEVLNIPDLGEKISSVDIVQYHRLAGPASAVHRDTFNICAAIPSVTQCSSRRSVSLHGFQDFCPEHPLCCSDPDRIQGVAEPSHCQFDLLSHV